VLVLKAIPVIQTFSKIDVFQLFIFHDPHDIADLSVGQMEYSAVLMKYDRHFAILLLFCIRF